MFEIPEFSLPEIDWSRLDFQWLVDDINLIITMMQIMAIGIPLLGIVIFVSVIFLFLRSISKVSKIEKHMREMKEMLREREY